MKQFTVSIAFLLALFVVIAVITMVVLVYFQGRGTDVISILFGWIKVFG